MFASVRLLSRRAAQAARLSIVRQFAAEASAAETKIPTPKASGGAPWGLILGTAAVAGAGLYAKQNGYLDSILGSQDKAAREANVKPDNKPNYDKVRNAISDIIAGEKAEDYDDGSYGPILVRLAWHCSGQYDKASNTGGSNGATMRFSPENGIGANAGLEVARNLLSPLKADFPWISYSDLWTLAGAVAIEDMGGPHIPWRPGRTDYPDGKNCPPDGRLPDGAKGAPHIRDVFYRMGFNDQEIVALSGAHAIGRCHRDRSGFDGPWTQSPITFSNQYFQLLVNEKWTKRKWDGPLQYEDSSKTLMMLPTDMALIWDRKFAPYVKEYAQDEDKFFKDFAAAFSKLMELGVPFPEGSVAA